MKGGTDLVVVKRHRCVENLVIGVGKCRKDEGNGTMGDGVGRGTMVLVPLVVAAVAAAVVVVAVVVVVVAACPDAGKVSLRSARSVRTRQERESRA